MAVTARPAGWCPGHPIEVAAGLRRRPHPGVRSGAPRANLALLKQHHLVGRVAAPQGMLHHAVQTLSPRPLVAGVHRGPGLIRVIHDSTPHIRAPFVVTEDVHACVAKTMHTPQ